MFSDLLFSLDEMLLPRRVIACRRLFILFLSSTSEIIMENTIPPVSPLELHLTAL